MGTWLRVEGMALWVFGPVRTLGHVQNAWERSFEGWVVGDILLEGLVNTNVYQQYMTSFQLLKAYI